MSELACDILIVGGGTGGTAAALALTHSGYRVILTEETDWIGGQLTSQAVPPDEHPWIEWTGCTKLYRNFRDQIRAHYRQRDLTAQVRSIQHLNPGGGWVSRLCIEPKLAHTVLQEMLQPAKEEGLIELLQHIPISAEVTGDRIDSVTFLDLESGDNVTVAARYFLDGTELGDLLALAGVEYVTGAESVADTGEPHALDVADPNGVQSFTWCAILGYDPDGQDQMDEPPNYTFWRDHQPDNWPDKLFSFTMANVRTSQPMHFPLFGNEGMNLFSYRQIVYPDLYSTYREPATCMNWPMNDYALGNVIDAPADREVFLQESRNLTLGYLYWLQSEHGYRGLHLRPDLAGTEDGLAIAPYFRESRRIKAVYTVREQEIASECNPGRNLAREMPYSVGVGAYRIDLHPHVGGRPTLDMSSLPFQIPLGCLIPQRVENLLPACKNIGTTHITNGCYRVHPVEWNIGEAAALCAAWCLDHDVAPRQLLNSGSDFAFGQWIEQRGIQRSWPEFGPL